MENNLDTLGKTTLKWKELAALLYESLVEQGHHQREDRNDQSEAKANSPVWL